MQDKPKKIDDIPLEGQILLVEAMMSLWPDHVRESFLDRLNQDILEKRQRETDR